MAKRHKVSGLSEIQSHLEKMRTALMESQRQLDKTEKAARELKKLLAAGIEKPAKFEKKKKKAGKADAKARPDRKALKRPRSPNKADTAASA